ncbi:MAG: sigma-54 dependent transcriptional regulator [Candidatus Cloacimonadales bacterium]
MILKKECVKGKRILVIDDDKYIRNLLLAILSEEAYEVKTAASAEIGLRLIEEFSPQIVLCDIKLPEMSGFDFLDRVFKYQENLDVIMITGYADVNEAVTAMKKGAFDYITKPFSGEEISMIIKKALATQHLQGEVNRLHSLLHDNAHGIVGESPQLKHVLKYIDLISPTELNVLINGKNGTGKDLTASIIHKQSKRKEHPFIEIDCSALPEPLMEALIFGYDIGAYKGDVEINKGKLEQADGGTVFINEVMHLTESAQSKLVNFLKTKTLSRIGSENDVELDVRIIASSSESLRKKIKQGKFREDLYYQLNEFELDLPELKERDGDVNILAKHFLALANAKYGKEIAAFSHDVEKLMEIYSWPGNIQELKNAVNRAVLICNGKVIKAEHIRLIDEVRRENLINLKGIEIQQARDMIESELIKEALHRASYNKSKAAEMLGYSRKTLYTKLSKHEIEL